MSAAEMKDGAAAVPVPPVVAVDQKALWARREQLECGGGYRPYGPHRRAWSGRPYRSNRPYRSGGGAGSYRSNRPYRSGGDAGSYGSNRPYRSGGDAGSYGSNCTTFIRKAYYL